MPKNIIAKLRLFLWLRVVSWIETRFAGSNSSHASSIVDLCLALKEELIDES